MLNLKNKLAKRILAFVLSGAMVVSGMTTSGITAFASQTSEDTGEYYEEMVDSTENEEDDADEKDVGKESSGEDVEETKENDNEQVKDTETSVDASDSEMKKEEEKKDAEVDNKSEDIDEHEKESKENEEEDSETDDADEKEQVDEDVTDTLFPAAYDSNLEKDVWSFYKDYIESGANNMLATITTGEKTQDRYDIIKDWYAEEAAVGASGTYVKSKEYLDMSGGLKYYSNGNTGLYVASANAPTDIPYFGSNMYVLDADSADGDGINETTPKYQYYGLMYGSGKLNEWYEIDAEAGNIITVYATSWNAGGAPGIEFGLLSNAGTKTLTRVSEPQTGTGNSDNKAYKLKFYAKESGTYYICSPDVKMCTVRITRERVDKVKVSGAITSDTDLSSAKLIFTDDVTKEEIPASITSSESSYSYSVDLYNKHSYTISTSEGFEVSEGATLDLSNNSGNTTHGVTLSEAAETVELSGSINVTNTISSDSDLLASLEVTFVRSDSTNEKVKAVLTTTNDTTTYTATLKTGVAYKIEAEADYINDYEWDTDTLTIPTGTTNTTQKDITFNALTAYNVTLNVSGTTSNGDKITTDILKTLGAKLVFTRSDKCEYTFTVDEDIKLRDGTYSVKTTNSKYVATINPLTINGAAATLTVAYKYAAEWDFTKYEEYNSSAVANKTLIEEWNGLTTTGKYHGKTYGLTIGNGTITVPVKGDCTVSVDAVYTYDFAFNEYSEENKDAIYQRLTASNDVQTYTYEYTGDEGTVSIIAGSEKSTYIKKITVTYIDNSDYTVTVNNADKCTISADKKNAKSGDTVTLTVTLNEGYMINDWTTSVAVYATDKRSEFTFKMPASDVEITPVVAAIKDSWNLLTLPSISSQLQGETRYDDGLWIDATATGAKWVLNSNGTWVQANTNTIIKIPVQGVSLVTVEGYDTAYSVDGKAATTAKGTFACKGDSGWVDIKMTGNSYLKSIKVESISDNYIITVDKVENGTASADVDYAGAGDTVTLTAIPETGYAVSDWEVTDPEDASISFTQDAADPNKYTFTMPGYHVTIKPVFEATGETYNIRTENTDNNGTVAGTEKKTAISGTIVKLSDVATATAKDGYEFKKWTITYQKDGETKNVTYTKDYTFIMPEGDVTISAAFEEKVPHVDVWDFGVKEEEDSLYTNNITAIALGEVVKQSGNNVILGDGNSGGTNEFGGLSINYGKGDRIYADKDTVKIDGITFPSLNNLYKQAYSDYTAAGGWYSNGDRSASAGYALMDVEAGDKIIVYVGNHQQTNDTNDNIKDDTENNYITFTFAGQGDASAQLDEAEPIVGRGFARFEFVAKYTGTYKFYQSAGNGKPFYNRIVRIPTVTVSGTIDTGDTGISGYGLTFINKTDASLPNVVATVDAEGNYTAQLSAGYQYKALLTGSGTSGYGIKFTEGADKVTTEIENIFRGITKNFEVVPQTTYTYSGTIEGFASDYSRVSDLKITMVPTSEFDVNEEELTIDTSNMTFTVGLQPEAVYTLKLEGVNDYEVTKPSQICIENNEDLTGQTITVGLKPMYSVTGGFIGLGDDVTVQSLTFTNVLEDSNYVYTAMVDNEDAYYAISLRDGEYLASATMSDESYSTTTHVLVDGGMVSQDLYFVSPGDKSAIEYVADIYVGYSKKTHNYKTVSEAVRAASRMKVDGQDRTAAERVTIHIAPGTYREQILVNTPYVSFVNDTSEEVLLTWYYGIGYVYYSAGSDGYYDAEKAYDKYTKHGVNRWGCAVRVTADYFQAKNITFENSFNRYITVEEIEDGAEPDASYGSGYYTDTSINVPRNYTTDVTSRAATERAAAIAIDNANYAEFYQCSFLSSQDTVYTSKTAYFKNCLLEGMTDYLFGDGDVVFDNCELSWKGYSDSTQGGYITAVQGTTEYGYLFRNCTVTANDNLKVGSGYFGRSWRQDAKVTFVNTKLQTAGMIDAKGWTDMSGATAANANFKEYNTTTLDGSEITYETPRSSKKVDTNPVSDVTTYFGNWTPAYYTPDGTGAVTFSADPAITDNGDINVPNPGHTLTVNYTLAGADAKSDASIIKWYIMDDKNGTNAELVKVSTAVVDKTYKITTAASGKYIKAEVTPETIDGRTGTAVSTILQTAVGSSYVDPSSGSNITVGDGINVYLAGDSTVTDYSAKGMWNGGSQKEDLGSWGEYLQSFFDEKEVTVQNFAQGGRSVRSFMNETNKYGVIEQNIGDGDYLFIQFGHNDSSTLENKKDVYTPIGAKGSDGKYPYTSGEKVDGKYPDYYTYSNGTINWDGEGTATYCWFLEQYIEMALEKGAIPVLMTPVSRMNYDSSGKTKKHHEDEGNAGSYYWEAVEQVYNDYKNEGVLFIDTYSLTKDLFDAAYVDGGAERGKEIMSISDGTHNNKLGGMIEAMLVAEAIQNLDTTLSYAVKTPAQAGGSTTTGKTVFSIDSSSNFTAYEQKFTGDKANAAYTEDTFTKKSDYWTDYGNTKLAKISEIAGNLADSNVSDKVVAAPKATSEMTEDANGNTIVTVTLSSTTEKAKIYYTDDGVTNPKTSDGKKAEAAKEYTDKIVLTEDTTIKAFAMLEDGDQEESAYKTPSKVVSFTFSVTPDVEAPTANKASGSTVASGTVIKLETATEGAVIRYTMGNGSKISNPTVNSRKYNDTTGLTVTSNTTIKAIAVKSGVASSVATFTYSVDESLEGTVAQPTANIPSGTTVALNETITLISSTPGAAIYYTLDGTTPTASDEMLYTGAIKITEGVLDSNNSVVITAIAVKEGMIDSDPVSFTYTVDKTIQLTTEAPIPNPPKGSKVKVGDIVTLSSATTGAKIIYTTDGNNPSKTSTDAVSSPASITITEDMVRDKKVIIKAMAITDDENRSDSEVVTIEYDVDDDNNQKEETGDTEESKIIVDTDTEDGKISVRSNKIKIEAADLAETGKVQYAVMVTYTHNGKQQQLTEGVHYKVELVTGSDGKSPTSQKINIIGTDDKTDLGTFVDKKTVSYTIKAKNDAKQDKAHDIAKKKFALKKADLQEAIYTGTYITPEVEDKDSVGEANYNIVYKNNVNVGKASVTIIGKGEYYGTKTLTFSIKKADLSKQTVGITAKNATFGDPAIGKTRTPVTPADGLEYKGEAVTFDNLKVKLGNVELSPRSDYTVTYKKNAQVGTATATIKGVNNLSGAITITYTIKAVEIGVALADYKAEGGTKAFDAEYSSKGARLTSITLNGVTLKEGKDYKVNYKGCKKADEITVDGTTIEKVAITGTGSYKNAFDKNTEVNIKVVQGSYHVKDNAVVDQSKLKGDPEKDNKTIINAAKITDAAGVKVKAEDVTITREADNYTKITVAPVTDTTNYKATPLDCHVATKLSSVKPTSKTAKLEDRKFDGVNAVTFTETEIVNAGVLDGVKAADIRIVSYKNNNKLGSATVTVEGRPESAFYGTKSLKFKIVTDKKPVYGENGTEESSSVEPSTGDEPSTEPSTGDEPSTEPSTGDEPSTEPSTGDEPSTEPSTGDEPSTEDTPTRATIWVVGDSTVCGFNDAYYIPRQGYGEQIKNYFNAEVYNYALSGRSSKSFTTESNYSNLINGGGSMPKLGAAETEGKFLIIGFGHNDEKSDEPARFTNPNGNYKTEGTFAKSLYDNYIKPALDAGVTPVVATPIVRYDESGSYTGSKVHNTSAGDYAQAIRDLCAEEELKDKVILADLTAATRELYMDPNVDAEKMHSFTGAEYTNEEKTEKKPAGRDDTHINSYGAKMVAWLLGDVTKDTALNKHWLNKEKPSEAADYEAAINKSYEIVEYTAPTEEEMKNSGWTAYTDASGREWYSTVFGNMGGASKIKADNFKTIVNEDKSIELQAVSGSGKINSSTDSYFFYYTRLPAGTNFELSATAKVNVYDATSSEVSYGLMARDDIHINEHIETTMGDYVAAGTLGKGDKNCFGRKSKELYYGPDATHKYVTVGDTVNLKITSNSDGYALTNGENETLSGGFDYSLTSVDKNYIYVGFYVTRKADITFSDILLTIKE